MSQVAQKIVISHNDRLGLTLFLAIVLHALIILGISFSSEDFNKPDIIAKMDITLVQYKSDKSPDKADYLAQENQKGSGNTQEKVRHRAVQSKPSPDQTHGQADQNVAATKTRPQKQGDVRVLTQKAADHKVTASSKDPDKIPVSKVSTQELIRRSKEIARLTAQNDAKWQAYSQLPDSKRLHANTKRSADAAYLAAWTRKIEKIGAMNFPYQARRQKLSGILLIEVALKPDGSLISVRILESSGHKVLDKAAMDIVRLGAPYARVPAEVLEDRKELRILRTWAFTVDNKLYSR
jgi:protein TonB